MPNPKYHKVIKGQSEDSSPEETRRLTSPQPSSDDTMNPNNNNPSVIRNPQGSQEEIDGRIIVTNFPSTHSSQQLVGQDNESVLDEEAEIENSSNDVSGGRLSDIGKAEWFAVTVLCFINLINYMDRFTIAGE